MGNPNLKVFYAANGWYVGAVRADGSHLQPSPESGCFYPDFLSARAALRGLVAHLEEEDEFRSLVDLICDEVLALGAVVDGGMARQVEDLVRREWDWRHSLSVRSAARQVAQIWD